MTQTPFQNTPYQEPVQDPGSITPTTIWNPLPGYDEQQQQLKENRDRYFDALIQNAKSKGASLDNALQRLAPLSQSIAQTLKPHLEYKRDEQIVEGWNKQRAVNKQKSPEELLSIFQQDTNEENEADSDVGVSNALASQALNDTGNVTLAEDLRNPLQELGAKRYALQQAAIHYPSFLLKAKAKISLEMSDGSQVAWDAANPEQKRELLYRYQNLYLTQFTDLPLPFVQKHLIDKIDSYHATEAVEAAAEARETYEDNLVKDRQTKLGSSISSYNVEGSDGVIQTSPVETYIRQNEIELGTTGAWAQLEEDVGVMLENGTISPEAVNTINKSKLINRATGSPITVEDLKPNMAKRLNWLAASANAERFKLREAQNKASSREYVEQVTNFLDKNEGPIDTKMRQQIINAWQPQWGPIPEEINSIINRESGDEALDQFLTWKESKNMPITKKDLNQFTDHKLIEKWKPKVENPLALTEDLQDDATETITAAVNQYTKETDALKGKTPKWVRIKQNAEKYYPLYYQQAIDAGAKTTNDAHLKAIEKVETDINNGAYNDRQISDLSGEENFNEASNAWRRDSTLPLRQILPGTTDDFDALVKFAETGVGEIPIIYYQLTANQKDITALQLANAQLMSQGIKPIDDSPEEELNNKPVEQRMLFKFKPTRFRISRYQLIDSGTNFNQEEYLLPNLA